jgi:predicted homoserine dehydrogenase-like protein
MSEWDDLEDIVGEPNPRWPNRYQHGLAHRGEVKTHCKRGHLLTPENVYPSSRACKTCARLRSLSQTMTAPASDAENLS